MSAGARYPELVQFLGGYLHQDWTLDAATADEAVDRHDGPRLDDGHPGPPPAREVATPARDGLDERHFLERPKAAALTKDDRLLSLRALQWTAGYLRAKVTLAVALSAGAPAGLRVTVTLTLTDLLTFASARLIDADGLSVIVVVPALHLTVAFANVADLSLSALRTLLVTVTVA